MWGVFARFSRVERSRILEAEAGALRELARMFVERFTRKANRRRPTLSLDNIPAALGQVGAAGQAGSLLRDKQTDWVQPMRGPLSDQQAHLLYEEALSYGLIEEDQEKWRWRHSLVYEYL